MDFHGQMPDHRTVHARANDAPDATGETNGKVKPMVKMPKPKLNEKKMDPAKFGTSFGIAVWLMTMDKNYQDLPIKELEKKILPAILLQQFKLYSKDGQPVAFLTWAGVSDLVKARIDKGKTDLELTEWRSGNNVVVLDCISPFNPKEVFEEEFWKGVREKD